MCGREEKQLDLPSLSSQKYGFRQTDNEREGGESEGEERESERGLIFYPMDCAFLWTWHLIHFETPVPSIETNIPRYLLAKMRDIFSHGEPTQFSEYIFNEAGDYLMREFK